MTTAPIIARVVARLLGPPILQNNIRGEVAEEIVAMALEPDWEHCSGDWGACDLRHRASGLRVQVKQSAARQSWHSGKCPPPRPRFSIAEKAGRWEDGDKWVPEPGRQAEIFIFAWHALTDAGADHRRPDQWLFYVVPEHALPPQKSISLAGISALASAVDVAGLAASVETAADAHRQHQQQQQER